MNRYRELLSEIAVPRLVGTPHNERVRNVLKRELSARGLVVMEQPFSATAMSLTRVAIAGYLLGFACLTAGMVIARSHVGPLAYIAVTLVGIYSAVQVVKLLLGRGALPWLGGPSHSAVSLIAVRPRTRVAVWLTAHYDAKGQPISMATRLWAAVLVMLQLPALCAFVAVHPGGSLASALLFLPGTVGGLLLGLNTVTARSAGAVDNASGVVTVLATLDALPAHAPVGVIFPDAEELGLVGARALVRERAHLLRDTAVVNLDGIDDRGGPIALVHRPGPLVEAIIRSLGARSARWLPVVVDGRVLARAARECVTIMRGDWRTARIVHTARDTPARLALTGCDQVAGGLVRALSAMVPR